MVVAIPSDLAGAGSWVSSSDEGHLGHPVHVPPRARYRVPQKQRQNSRMPLLHSTEREPPVNSPHTIHRTKQLSPDDMYHHSPFKIVTTEHRSKNLSNLSSLRLLESFGIRKPNDISFEVQHAGAWDNNPASEYGEHYTHETTYKGLVGAEAVYRGSANLEAARKARETRVAGLKKMTLEIEHEAFVHDTVSVQATETRRIGKQSMNVKQRERMEVAAERKREEAAERQRMEAAAQKEREWVAEREQMEAAAKVKREEPAERAEIATPSNKHNTMIARVMTQSRSRTPMQVPPRKPRKFKMELPMILAGETIPSTPDSGSEENIIANAVVSILGLEVEDAPEYQKEFRLGNNRVVKALGRIAVVCSFARDSGSSFKCCFYVFSKLVTPIIMGMAFLDTTETLTKHKHRLQPRCSPTGSPMMCASLNNPKRRLRCFAAQPGAGQAFSYANPSWRQHYTTLANADTGSEIDLVSFEYCQRQQLPVEKLETSNSTVQFADGSTASLAGQVQIRVMIGRFTGDVIGRTFYVLPELTCDMIFGEDFLDEFDAFETYKDAISIEDDQDVSQVNYIAWVKDHEQWFFWGKKEELGPPAVLSTEIESLKTMSSESAGGIIDQDAQVGNPATAISTIQENLPVARTRSRKKKKQKEWSGKAKA